MTALHPICPESPSSTVLSPRRLKSRGELPNAPRSYRSNVEASRKLILPNDDQEHDLQFVHRLLEDLLHLCRIRPGRGGLRFGMGVPVTYEVQALCEQRPDIPSFGFTVRPK